MAYAIELDDGTIIEVPDLASDGRNWKTYRDYILHVAALENLVPQYNGTDAKPNDAMQHELKEWEQRNNMAKLIIMLTIPDSLLMCIMHLETACEWFNYLADRFETKKSDVTQREATCNPRTAVGTRQKRSERTRKPQEHEATVNERENAAVAESRDASRRERKRDSRDQERVEKRVRKGRKAARRTGEQEAAAREPGEEATDEPTRSVSLAVTLSSQDDNSRDMGVPCTRVIPREPQSTSPVANDVAADAVNPNATSAGPPEPAGTSHELRDEPHESAGSYPGSRGENDDSRGPGTHWMRVTAQRPQAATGEASADATNPNATSVGPPRATSSPHEEPAASAPPSVPLEGERESETVRRRTARMGADAQGESTTDQGSDGISLAVPASSLNGREVEMSTDEATNTTANAHTPGKPPSMLLEGEHNAQKCMNGTCTGRQHDATAHGEVHSAWAELHNCCTTSDSPRGDSIAGGCYVGCRKTSLVNKVEGFLQSPCEGRARSIPERNGSGEAEVQTTESQAEYARQRRIA
ncbi:hypothetical protein BU15DRAFT_80475 [Melanogaster broomeanus]|nr:hypothetical protein BU15DRAFT_80475 [Melanogaster broomeanus]